MRKAALWAPTEEDKDSIIETLITAGQNWDGGKDGIMEKVKDAKGASTKGCSEGKCLEDLEISSEARTPSSEFLCVTPTILGPRSETNQQ